MNTARVVIQPVIGDVRAVAPEPARPPAAPAGPRRQVLLCRVTGGTRGGDAGRLVALPIAEVVETMRPLPVQTLPGLPGYVRGVAMIRGAGTPVVDLAALLVGRDVAVPPVPAPTGPAAGSTMSARFVTLALARPGGSPRLLALAVDEVVGVRDLDAASAGDLPPLLAAVDRGLITSLGTLDEDLLHVLEVSGLVAEDLWPVLDDADRELRR